MTLPHFDLPPRAQPLVLIWPDDGNPVAPWTFAESAEWWNFVSRLSLDPHIPDITRLKFEPAQKLFLLGSIVIDLLRGAEFVALTALEVALKDCFGHVVEQETPW